MADSTEWFGEPVRDPVVISEPDPRWAQLFERYRTPLAEALGPAALRIDYVGSSAVPDLAAKPVIDIQVSMADVGDEDTYAPAIESLGWPLRAREPDHRFFRAPASVKRFVHVHVCSAGSKRERDHLLFVAYLRTHPDHAAAYASLKRELAARFGRERESYTNAKDGFIAETLTEAEDWGDCALASIGRPPRRTESSSAPPGKIRRRANLGCMNAREATPKDARDIARINVLSWKASVQGHLPCDRLEGLEATIDERSAYWVQIATDSSPGDVLLVVEAADEVIGFIHALPSRDPFGSGRVAEIVTLFVEPQLWGQGAGKMLLDEALERLRAAGYTRVTLWVLDFNDRARRFYEAAGFQLDRSTKQSEFEGNALTEVRYRKEL
ncbi:MAG: GNAT family N-acetyltransferase [Actinomycetota bacterium]